MVPVSKFQMLLLVAFFGMKYVGVYRFGFEDLFPIKIKQPNNSLSGRLHLI